MKSSRLHHSVRLNIKLKLSPLLCVTVFMIMLFHVNIDYLSTLIRSDTCPLVENLSGTT